MRIQKMINQSNFRTPASHQKDDLKINDVLGKSERRERKQERERERQRERERDNENENENDAANRRLRGTLVVVNLVKPFC